MIKNSEKQEMAKIAVGKSLLKEYKDDSGNRLVYLENDTEFQIQLYNNQSTEVGVKVYINNKPLRHLLVLRPAERCWLERYTDKAVKFKFTTYKIDGSEESKELTAENGKVRVEFYRKQENYSPIHVYYDNWYNNGVYGSMRGINTSWIDTDATCYYSSSSYSYCAETADSLVDTSASTLSTASLSMGSVTPNLKNQEIETGRIEEGTHSDQSFETTYVDFEYTPFHTEIIKILPMSAKPVHVGDLQKLYCPECGRKLNSKYKFCPYCGTKLEE